VAVSTKSQQCSGTLPWDFKNFPYCLELGFGLTPSSVLGHVLGLLSFLLISALCAPAPMGSSTAQAGQRQEYRGSLLRPFAC